MRRKKPNPAPKTLKMSEARYNDLVYLTLKKLFFEPVFGEESSPRGCDIRVCMELASDEMMMQLAHRGVLSAILSPTEVAPTSHTQLYDIDTERVFDVCVDYISNHWAKQEPDPKAIVEFKELYKKIVETVMQVPEEKCGG